ncbi:hypothetical protein OJAV_G00166770 [Oryzias javanicus]|uniref:Ig-like domain-containing protein n=1 Tax=Oryzias javanicus TaxID=123683 RepID=A0A437CFW4_ORYJA|nr:hypothetical protein OJAV_G00166770 [Oryzias javanicus]
MKAEIPSETGLEHFWCEARVCTTMDRNHQKRAAEGQLSGMTAGLIWSSSLSSIRTFQNKARVQKTEELIYNISSSLTLSDSEDELDHICTISTPSQQRKASWRRRHECSTSSGPISQSDHGRTSRIKDFDVLCHSSVKLIPGEANISCSSSDSSLRGFSLVWFNQRQMIETKNEDDEQRVSEE